MEKQLFRAVITITPDKIKVDKIVIYSKVRDLGRYYLASTKNITDKISYNALGVLFVKNESLSQEPQISYDFTSYAYDSLGEFLFNFFEGVGNQSKRLAELHQRFFDVTKAGMEGLEKEFNVQKRVKVEVLNESNS